MTVPPEYSEEDLFSEQAEGTLVPGRPDLTEAEIDEHAREEFDEHARAKEELNYLDPEGNEAHAPGQVCPRCGTVITAGQDVRLRADGRWMHEVCPVDLSGLSAGDPQPEGHA